MTDTQVAHKDYGCLYLFIIVVAIAVVIGLWRFTTECRAHGGVEVVGIVGPACVEPRR